MVKESIERKVLIREFDKERDIHQVGKLEMNLEIANNVTKKRVSIFTNMTMMAHPLSRIRFYPLHVMLVAELLENGELVGVIRGCIKSVGTHSASILKMGSILGLRVSPLYWRKGIGLKLIRSVEEWIMKNGAEYTLLATEKKNEASRNLFTKKCNYFNLSSLLIFVQPITSSSSPSPTKHISVREINIDKLQIDLAVSLYRKSFKTKDMFPTDIEAILKEKLTLGTWVCYYKDEGWFNGSSGSNWIIFSIWNNTYDCEANYKLQHTKTNNNHHHNHPLGFLYNTLNHAREKIFPYLRMLLSGSSLSRPFGFLFIYGLHGEGENLGELMESIFRFTSRLGENMKGCKVSMTELGFGDPLVNVVPHTASMSCIEDLWYIKRISDRSDKNEELLLKGGMGNVFVDPREF